MALLISIFIVMIILNQMKKYLLSMTNKEKGEITMIETCKCPNNCGVDLEYEGNIHVDIARKNWKTHYKKCKRYLIKDNIFRM